MRIWCSGHHLLSCLSTKRAVDLEEAEDGEIEAMARVLRQDGGQKWGARV